MQSINRSLSSPAHLTSNLISTEKNSLAASELVSINRRIEENRPLLDKLKIDSKFQNVLTLMRKNGIPEKSILNFLIGRISLPECMEKFDGPRWMKYLLNSSVRGMIEWHRSLSDILGAGPFDEDKIPFLSKQLADPLSSIFNFGYFESDEKTQAKIHILMRVIEKENCVGKLDLRELNLANCDLRDADLSGVDCCRADFSNANLSRVDFRGSDLTEAKFCRADLTGADFRGVNLTDAVFLNNNLTSVIFVGATSSNPSTLNVMVLKLIEEQNKAHAFEIYKLLSKATEWRTFEGTNFPKELVIRICRDATFLTCSS